nr:MAG TPA: hypothetical protein [Bacteriophage sp.]
MSEVSQALILCGFSPATLYHFNRCQSVAALSLDFFECVVSRCQAFLLYA